MAKFCRTKCVDLNIIIVLLLTLKFNCLAAALFDPINGGADLPILRSQYSVTQPSFATAQRQFLLQSATYCPSVYFGKTWTCKPCYQSGAHLYKLLTNSSTDMNVAITINNSSREVAVSVRGALGLTNLLHVVPSYPVVWKTSIGPDDMKVHPGFLTSMLSISPQINATLLELFSNLPSNYKLVWGGHSLGGSVAGLLIALFYGTSGYENIPMELFTYGAPRIGNIVYAQYMNSLNIGSARVVHAADLFPHLLCPTYFGYLHSSNELYIPRITRGHGEERYCSNAVMEDPDCSNALSPRYNLLDHLTYYDGLLLTDC